MDTQFYQWLIVKIILFGLVIQIVVVQLYEWLKKYWKNRGRSKNILKYAERLKEFNNNFHNYIVLGQNENLKPSFFDVERTNITFVIPFPENKVDELKRRNFKPVVINGEEMSEVMKKNQFSDRLLEHLYELIVQNGVKEEEKEKFLQEIAESTADKFILDIQKGKVRFNKYLYGVDDCRAKGQQCTISLYESDYFTFKTITNVYNELKKRNNGTVNLGLHPAPFLNSIGVGGFVIVNRGEGDELIWGFRGTNCQSGGYWHFSFDETFTHDDAEKDRAADLIRCIKRALTEELGIHPEEQEKCVADIQLLDCGIIRTEGNDNRYEFEVCSFVRICLSEKYAIRDFIQNYRFAKDAELETRCLKLVKIADLDQFMKENENNMSPEAKVLALKIKTLSDLNLLESDDESYRRM